MILKSTKLLYDYLIVDDKVTRQQERLMGFPNSAKEVERLVHESIEELKELERLAKIGDAFEKAKNEKFEFIQYTPYAGARTEYYPIEDEEYSKVIEWASR